MEKNLEHSKSCRMNEKIYIYIYLKTSVQSLIQPIASDKPNSLKDEKLNELFYSQSNLQLSELFRSVV